MNKSFTLIELIIVIAILGLLIGLSIPTFSPFLGNVKLNAAVKQIAAELRLAQEKAIAEHIISEVDLTNYKLPTEVKIENPQIIKFASSGNPLPGSSGTIILNCKNKTKKIVISSIGRIRIE